MVLVWSLGERTFVILGGICHFPVTPRHHFILDDVAGDGEGLPFPPLVPGRVLGRRGSELLDPNTGPVVGHDVRFQDRRRRFLALVEHHAFLHHALVVPGPTGVLAELGLCSYQDLRPEGGVSFIGKLVHVWSVPGGARCSPEGSKSWSRHSDELAGSCEPTQTGLEVPGIQNKLGHIRVRIIRMVCVFTAFTAQVRLAHSPRTPQCSTLAPWTNLGFAKNS